MCPRQYFSFIFPEGPGELAFRLLEREIPRETSFVEAGRKRERERERLERRASDARSLDTLRRGAFAQSRISQRREVTRRRLARKARFGEKISRQYAGRDKSPARIVLVGIPVVVVGKLRCN